MPSVSRTLGPLHLEDLEPHRFEDLVRQLLYDFRPWRDLEATGRTGTDGGFDVRATELVRLPADAAEPAEGDEPTSIVFERQWLIQCKREKTIGPKKLEEYLDGLPSALDVELYGLVFAAACDFSIQTRDRFYARARERGFDEAKLWGKAEIEDQLYQPKNDHLLFAYFGVSLQARRRLMNTNVRARLAAKRKAKRLLQRHVSVLVRDAGDDRYPYLAETQQPREFRGRWGIWNLENWGAFGLELAHRRHFAFIDDDGEHWDYAERMNDATAHDDPWPDEKLKYNDAARAEDYRQWNELPEANRAWLDVMNVLAYDSIIDIDEDGDEFFSGPHIYVQPFAPEGRAPFSDYYLATLSTGQWGRSCKADAEKRVKLFPREGEVSPYKDQ